MKRNKPRNHIALNPLLRKGGAHVRSKSGERFVGKRKTMKAAREWQGSRDAPFTNSLLSKFSVTAIPARAPYTPSVSCVA